MAIATHVQGWGPEEGGERAREGRHESGEHKDHLSVDSLKNKRPECGWHS